ncbi:MAG: LamG domain-containing protein [Verrucomicrobia bacterium]|nr:LamG domain-containing protein [Verrucomicrobiota bacterium]
MVGQAFAFDGSSQYVEIPGSEDLHFTTNITMEAWIKTDTILSFCAPIIAKGDTEWRMQTAGTSPYLNIGLNRSGGGGLVSGINGTRNIVDGHWHHVAAVYDGSTAYLYVDGTVDVSGPASGVIGQNSYPVRIGGNAEQDRRWSGLIDEVSIYATALSSNQIAAIYAARAAGKCIFLRISAQPLSQVGYWGKSATFSVVAQTAALPLSYQWQKDSVPIAGATDASLVLTNLQATNAGVYTVVVSDQSTNVVTSAPANLTVNPAGVSIAVYPGLTIDGVVGQIYGIQSTTDLNNTNSWSGVTNLTLALPVELWYDSQPVTQPTRYYRVVAGPISIP